MSSAAGITYFKRCRMEVRLVEIPLAQVPPGFVWMAWSRDLLDVHARVLYHSFHREIDATVFPSLGDILGCHVLMTEICCKRSFIPEATWLLAAPDGTPCGTVQGLQVNGRGAIQNVGVLPEFRGQGVGSALILQALHGFRRHGLALGTLEATDRNDRAIRLYRRLGFTRTRILYRPVPDSGCEVGEFDNPRDWSDFE